MVSNKRALISVYDKTGIIEFAKELQTLGYEIVSTGGTADLLSENNLNITKVEDITGTKELLSGKVKTLHPNIFAGILADITNQAELDEIAENNISNFDLVVVNLYPFEKVAKEDAGLEELVKNIDIGGVALLRAAAKNSKNVTVVSSTDDYNTVLKAISEDKLVALRENLALKAFYTTSKYDSIILKTLSQVYGNDDYETISLNKIQELRYGENPHQKAGLYNFSKTVDYEVLNGKELSYNNILDITAALNVISEFYDVPSVSIIKHLTPCGVAIGKDITEAYLKAFDCDPISAFGGIIAFTKPVNVEIAKHANSVFLEVLIAPDFEPEALEILKSKKNIRLIKLNTELKEYKNFIDKEIKLTPFGALVQETDKKEFDKDSFKVVSKKKPTVEMIEDMVFAFKIAKHVKSNAIVIAKDFKTIGICGGQTSRIDAVEIALNRACDGSKEAILASDGFFPAIDNIQSAAQGRIAGIIQPGGSIKDKDVIAAADKFEMVMITTGVRHFKH